MIAENDSIPDSSIWSVETLPAEVDAGAEFIFKYQIALPPDLVHSGLIVSVRDHDDVELATAELTQFDGKAYVAAELPLKAPLTVGAHVWRALIVHDEIGTSFEGSSTEFSFVVKAHAIRLNVWDLPTAIAAGERFTFKVGFKCSAGCELVGRELSIFDDESVQVGTGNLLDDVWPGTSALYFAEIETKAPLTVGEHEWEIRIPASSSGAPHASGALAFPVKVVQPPDCEVTVEVIDAEKQMPIKGARVVMHPYRTLTDNNGVAKVKVVKGTYKLLVSGTRYISTASTVEVTDDITVKSELFLEPVVDQDSYYV